MGPSSEEPFKFFWRSDTNPFSPAMNATWSPYVEGDNQYLETQYQLFLKDPKIKRGGLKNERQNMHAYYISLMAALKYFSQETLKNLEKAIISKII